MLLADANAGTGSGNYAGWSNKDEWLQSETEASDAWIFKPTETDSSTKAIIFYTSMFIWFVFSTFKSFYIKFKDLTNCT